MIPMLGRTLILLALTSAALGSVLGFAAALRRSADALRWARICAYAFAVLMVAANVLMEVALLTHDFSVSYVAQVGSRSSPTWVTIVSLWSSLEGSILFWGFILGLYVGGATWHLGDRYPEHTPWAIGLMLLSGVFFAFLIAGPAHPFNLVSPAPLDGPGPNPLLQNHVLMVVHPPSLYLGYVGMAVPFAIAGAALLAGRLGHEILRPLRVWLMIPWIFLTIGIVLGGWWAYEVLGWGGYWAWDPVENASLLPWLTATAALHSLLVVERRGILKGWTLTLVLSSFLLTILGTFMTRSGVFNSVHSFTQSDIGPTFLGFLAVALVFTVVLLAARIGMLEGEGAIEDAKSREGLFLVNNLVFVLLTLTVLLGTVFPLIVEAVQGKKISVGEPYFNAMAVPLGVALLFILGVGPALPWGRASWAETRKALLPPLATAAAAVVVGVLLGGRSPMLILAVAAAGYAFHVTVVAMILPVRRQVTGKGAGAAFASLVGSGRRRFGGYVVHAGVVMVLLAVAVSSAGKLSTEVALKKGESTKLGDYTLTFEGARSVPQPHREQVFADIRLTRGEEDLGFISPAMNFYRTQREPVGTPAVRSGPVRDIYLSVMSVDMNAQQVGIRAFLNPMVAWIWVGMVVMALGGLLALVPVGKRAAAVQPLPLPRRQEARTGPEVKSA